MESSKLRTSADQAARIVARLDTYWPTPDVSDPQVFQAGVIELLTSYPQDVTERALSVLKGLPAKFTFWPRIAEIKAEMDGWAAEYFEHWERVERFSRPALPPPEQTISPEEDAYIRDGFKRLSEHYAAISKANRMADRSSRSQRGDELRTKREAVLSHKEAAE